MARLNDVLSADESAPVVDMSPMIDLVFLLLIFFIVSAQMVDFSGDPEVKPPVADAAKKSETGMEGRLLINIRQDGTLWDHQTKEITLEAFKVEVAAHVQRCKEANITPKLFLRVDRLGSMEATKRINRAAAEAGLADVIFSSYAVDTGE
jgi:biopolymer transport protein ExbD